MSHASPWDQADVETWEASKAAGSVSATRIQITSNAATNV